MGAPSEIAWPEGAASALSLTFDGGLPEHWELVAPILSENEIRATFFVTVPALLENPDAWRTIVAQGHEVGSHSHLNVSTNGALVLWTLDMVEDDLKMADKGIWEVTGVVPHSFALSGPETTCADGDYFELLRKRFANIRGVDAGPNEVAEVDLARIKCSFWRDLVGPVESYLPRKGQWSVPVFESFFDQEFGAAEEDLRVLIGHLKQRADIWVAPLGEVGAHIAATRGPLESNT